MAAELRRSRFNLSARLLVLAAVAVLPALALLVYDDFTLSRDREIEAQGVAREQVNLAAAEMRQIVEGVHNLLAALSRLPALRNHDAGACTAILTDLESHRAVYRVVAATDAEGQVFCAGRAGTTQSASVRDRDYFQNAAATGRFAAGGYATDRLTGKKTIHFAYPYVDAQGNFAGVVYAALSLDWLGRHFRATPWPPGSIVTLADRQGTALVSLPDDRQTGTPVPARLRPLITANGGGTQWAGSDDRKWITAYSPIVPGRNEIFAAVEISQKQALAEVKQTIRHGVLIILASFVLALAGAAAAGRYFIGRPVDRLLRAAERLSLGDYGFRTELTRTAPEFRRLAEAFDHMAMVIQRREHELKEATRAKSQLLAAAGHDLKQPLQVMSMALEQLGRAPASPQAPRHLKRGEWAVQRLARALDNLLTGSRVESGVVTPQKQVTPVADLLREVAENFAPLAQQKGLRLRVVTSSALIDSDPELLWDVLQNLVGNAVKYTERGRILVGCRRRGGALSIQVIDTGPGIPPDKFAAVFEEFQRLHPGSGSGVGLGLAIVKRIAGLLGHGIELRSTLGKGSCFALEVPLAPERPHRRRGAAAYGEREGACRPKARLLDALGDPQEMTEPTEAADATPPPLRFPRRREIRPL